MSYHDNARTTTHQRQRIRQRRTPYRVQSQALASPGRLPHITREMPSVFAISSSI
jgi:hypothetical protein